MFLKPLKYATRISNPLIVINWIKLIKNSHEVNAITNQIHKFLFMPKEQEIAKLANCLTNNNTSIDTIRTIHSFLEKNKCVFIDLAGLPLVLMS
ncbi:hypothetical protein NEPAR04_0227 [Nematocida parisii]|nr:hypothetical protein NEPAR08_0221 [Nematocida parisii]KAI5126150.1 hypothetical protein NEPAR03_0322 [Nematocida parisii]KAI5140395.1 hypothetical protein NEPAR04_0227 [Nematocida parisii]